MKPLLLNACTSNAGKLREFLHAGERTPEFQIVALPGLKSIPPPAEDGMTFMENAQAKALYYSRHAEGPIFADDSGLVVDALSGEPGVRSARYAGEHATDAQNNALLLSRMETIADRVARFVCVIALAHRGRLMQTAQGTVEGTILKAARGDAGFGYDPLFLYGPLAKTLAELSEEEKLKISHRGQAMRELFRWLQSVQPVF